MPRMKETATIVAEILIVASALYAAESSPAKGPEGPFPGKIRLELPKTIDAVPGIETNVYFDNVMLSVGRNALFFDVTCAKGVQQVERWTFTPDEKEVGEYPFTLEVRDGEKAIVARAVSTIRVLPKDAGKGAEVSILVIGDSLTAASVYPKHLYDLCAGEGNPRLKMIGSCWKRGAAKGPYRHEGYGGWTAKAFATRIVKGSTPRVGEKRATSPFLYEGADGKMTLDFARYCQEFNDGKGPDFVTIFLGCNDTFSATDETIEDRIDDMLKHYDMLVRMIHSVRKDTRIGCLLLPPPAATQDAFGANYGCGQTRRQYRRNQHRVVERMTAHYGGRENEHIYLVPVNVNIDCERNYPQRTVPANARSDRKIARHSNGVHPAASGYLQIGDSLYCWLKGRLAASAE